MNWNGQVGVEEETDAQIESGYPSKDDQVKEIDGIGGVAEQEEKSKNEALTKL